MIFEFSRSLFRSYILGRSVKVTEKQFKRIYNNAKTCSKKLDYPMPEIFITQEPTINALTLALKEKSIIVLNSATIDHFEDAEIRFVIGHELGHIQNNHAIYHTVARWLTPQLMLIHRGWMRASEITADRAGMICAGDINSSSKALVKLALGAKRLYKELDIDEYLKQLEELKKGFGRLQEIFMFHPFLPKRVTALKIFSESNIFKKQGLRKEEIDRKVRKLIGIL
jgi:Zn-dependent protease with chaperone function